MADVIHDDRARVRAVLARELETISFYEQLAGAAEAAEAKAFFEHLAREEKEHVAEATALLRRLDADQEATFQREYSAEHFDAAAKKPPAPMPERLPVEPGRVLHAIPAPPIGGKLTVGSLRRQPIARD